MPKEDPMSQVSRPFQIALAAMVVLVMVWFVALRGKNTPSEPTPAPSAATPSTVYKGSAPGVKGLTKDINKAHGAVSTSEQNAKELQSKSAKASGEAAPSTSSSSGTSSASPSSHSSAGSSGAAGASTTSKSGSSQASKLGSKSSSTAPGKTAGTTAGNSSNSRQATIQHELARGKVVLLMFWNPKSSDDQSVRGQLHDVSRRSGHVAVHVALPLEVGEFGGYTQGVEILQTPTILVIDTKGQVTTLTGLNDARTIQQAIGDALRGGSGTALVPKFTAWLRGSTRASYIAKASKYCTAPSKKAKQTGTTVAQQLTTFKAEVPAIDRAIGHLKAIPPPPKDRAYLESLYAMETRGVHLLAGAIGSVHGNPLKAREMLLEAQVQFDQSDNSLASYGLSACAVELH
jgi:hypothetical protein